MIEKIVAFNNYCSEVARICIIAIGDAMTPIGSFITFLYNNIFFTLTISLFFFPVYFGIRIKGAWSRPNFDFSIQDLFVFTCLGILLGIIGYRAAHFFIGG